MNNSRSATLSSERWLRDLVVVASVTLLALFTSTSAAHASVPLGDADSFAILAGQSVTNTGSTTIDGDIGISPGAGAPSNLTDNGTITQDGTIHDADTVAQDAQASLTIAYDDAASRAVTETILPELAGQDLGPGVYQSTGAGAFQLSAGSTLTLTGDAEDVWIFKSTSTLVFFTGSQIVLDGVDPCNVFWQVGSSATLGTDTTIVGTIMALTTIALETGAELEGRALARNGSVTMDSNTITNAPCVTPVDDTPDDTPVDTQQVENGQEAAPEPEATPVEPPTRVDTGRGSSAPLTAAQTVLVLLAATGVGSLIVLRRRFTNSP
jgi:hypothetical protein